MASTCLGRTATIAIKRDTVSCFRIFNTSASKASDDCIGCNRLPGAPNQCAHLRRRGWEFIDVAEILVEGPVAVGRIVNADAASGALPKPDGILAVVHHDHRAVIREDPPGPILQK